RQQDENNLTTVFFHENTSVTGDVNETLEIMYVVGRYRCRRKALRRNTVYSLSKQKYNVKSLKSQRKYWVIDLIAQGVNRQRIHRV
ncbi:MAG TPA: hypothetical protein VK470_00060, partial [Bacteroidota bacterium]|nr:hypothetical protein [Bacteroidota bacterium]